MAFHRAINHQLGSGCRSFADSRFRLALIKTVLEPSLSIYFPLVQDFSTLPFFCFSILKSRCDSDFLLKFAMKKYFEIRKMNNEQLMRRAIALSEESVSRGGGPFGAVIAQAGRIVAEASNSVTIDNDPTAHAEVNCIRQAAAHLGTFDLSGCEIYTSCEPCPMCLGAIYWARLDRIYYANDRKDAARIGFDDDFIYQEMPLNPENCSKQMTILLPEEAVRAFRMWEERIDKTAY